MATPNQYATNGTPSASDLLLSWSTGNSDTRKISFSAFGTWLQSYLGGSSSGVLKQYYAPATTGFNVVISPAVNGQSVRLLMTPTGTLAAGTITLPVASTCVDQQYVVVTSTQTVTALTIALNGATAVNGTPTTIAANGFFWLEYDKPSNSWYRIG